MNNKLADTYNKYPKKINKELNRKDIKNVQLLLKEKGYDIGYEGVDSIYGKHTKAALMKYQKDNGLRVDGIIGKNTLKSLNDNIKNIETDELDDVIPKNNTNVKVNQKNNVKVKDLNPENFDEEENFSQGIQEDLNIQKNNVKVKDLNPENFDEEENFNEEESFADNSNESEEEIINGNPKAIQEFLNTQNNEFLNVDGIIGPKTRAAIKKFQKNTSGLSPTGKIDRKTYDAMFDANSEYMNSLDEYTENEYNEN